MHVEILIVTIFPLWFLNISSFFKKKREVVEYLHFEGTLYF